MGIHGQDPTEQPIDGTHGWRSMMGAYGHKPTEKGPQMRQGGWGP